MWHGTPYRLIQQAHGGAVSLVSSPALLEELAEVLAREQFAAILARSGTTAAHLLKDTQRLDPSRHTTAATTPVCRDPDDNAVLAAALAAQVDLIVSGDDDLLTLHAFQGIPIVNSAEAINLCAKG